MRTTLMVLSATQRLDQELEAITLWITRLQRSVKRRENRLALRLAALAAAETGVPGGPPPERWQVGARWRCINEHVSSQFASSGRRQKRCIFCRGRLFLTFPEDHSGPWARAGDSQIASSGIQLEAVAGAEGQDRDVLSYMPDQHAGTAEVVDVSDQPPEPLSRPDETGEVCEMPAVPDQHAPATVSGQAAVQGPQSKLRLRR